MWNFYEWDLLDDFNTWHEAIKTQLGYPLIGINQGSGLPDENACWTTEYTSTKEVEGKFIALVETEYAEGLTPTDLRVPRNTIDPT